MTPSRILRLVISAAVGIALAVIASRFLFVGSALTLLPWGIAGLVIGYFSAGRGEAVLNGVVYGFLLTFVFLVAGYTGSEPITSPMPFLLCLAYSARFVELCYPSLDTWRPPGCGGPNAG